MCRRVEQRQRDRIAAELNAEVENDEDDPSGWEAYIRTGGNLPPNPHDRLLHTPPPGGSPPDSIRTNVTYRNAEDGSFITHTYVVSADDIQDEHYVAYD